MTDQVFTFGADEPVKNDIIMGDDPGFADDNVLGQLKKVLGKKIERNSILLEVPERPELTIRYSPNINQQQLKSWRRNSGEDSKNGLDGIRFACHVLANTCIGFVIDGQDITVDGAPVGFNHEQAMAMTGANRVFDCVRAVYGLDPHVEAAALAVLDAAGWNDAVEQVDPTKNS